MKRNVDAKNLISGFLAGILVGTAVSLLAAPRSGKLTRNKIVRDSKKLKKQFYSSLNDSLESMKGYLQNVRTEAREKGKKIKGKNTRNKSQEVESARIGKVGSRQGL